MIYILLEKEAGIGYSQTEKYDSVRRDTIREMNNLPFEHTYKASDPDLLPTKIVVEGFESYVRKYNINIWLAAEVKKCVPSCEGVGWIINVRKGKEVYLIQTKHLILSIGASLSVPIL